MGTLPGQAPDGLRNRARKEGPISQRQVSTPTSLLGKQAQPWVPSLLTLCPVTWAEQAGRQVWMSRRVSGTGEVAWPSGGEGRVATAQHTHLETRAKASEQMGGQGTRRMARRPRALG